jgi:2-polyprenyl-6-methoxyphenol hydroxylase-like FAD-dependent oxidoreductase
MHEQMSRTVIIGGGVAGLSLAIALRKMGRDVVVCERERQDHSNGHAFLIHPEAMRVLEDIIETDPYHLMPGRKIEQLFLKNSNDELLQEVGLDGWICMKRCEAMAALASQLPDGVIQYGCQFSHFVLLDDKVVGAAFKNGETIQGDIFIGADGAKSAVRNALFGPTNYTPVLVKEILGTINNKSLFDRHPNHFTKYLSVDKGLAVGFIPCNDEELIWFLQFDVALNSTEFTSEDSIADFCKTILSDFPDEVKEIMDCKSVQANYVWNTTDFDVLPTFYKWNVLLIGDAAHLALPFTSAGVTNALLDVDCLMNLWNTTVDYRELFSEFYSRRAPHIQGHVEMGRLIRSSFLKGAAKEVRLPLIQDLSTLADS